MAKKRITSEMVAQAEELAALGLQRKAIAQALGVNPTTLTPGRNSRLSRAIQKGHQRAREEIIAQVRAHAEIDAGTAFKLAEKLGCFLQPLEVKKPETAQDAKELLADAMVALAAGEIDENRARTLQHMVTAFCKVVEVCEFKKRLDEIEELLDSEDGTL